MGSRSGDLDPSVGTYIMEKDKLTAEELENRLNKESGAYGISNVSLDFRDIEAEAAVRRTTRKTCIGYIS